MNKVIGSRVDLNDDNNKYAVDVPYLYRRFV